MKKQMPDPYQYKYITEEELMEDMTRILLNDNNMVNKWSLIELDTRKIILKLWVKTINIYIRNGYIFNIIEIPK